MTRHRATNLLMLLALVAILGYVRHEVAKPRPAVVARDVAAPPAAPRSHRADRGRGNYPVAVEPGRLVSKVTWSDGKVTRHLNGPER